MPSRRKPVLQLEDVTRHWLSLQGLSAPRGTKRLSKRTLGAHLEGTGALQLDSVNVLDRAHYLTLWSRFGCFDRRQADRWTHGSGIAYEYWGHEASILPISHLPLGLRRMRRFPGDWAKRSWWDRYKTSAGSKRRVLRRLRAEGPLESSDFERTRGERGQKGHFGADSQLPKEDKRSLQLLWHSGRVAVRERRHFRRVYDLAERVYPDVAPASPTDYEDSWLLIGLAGSGVASARHLANYFTGPSLKVPAQKRAIRRNLASGRIVEVEVPGLAGPCFALAEHVDAVRGAPESRGTTLICPFDSLLWQRKRAEDLLGFRYRVEIYIPQAKREFGYYVLPILHEGRLVGRLDPKLHRDRGELEIMALFLEEGVTWSSELRRGLRATLEDLAEFTGAKKVTAPKPWRRRLGAF